MRILRAAAAAALFAACGYDWTVVPRNDTGTTACRTTKECPSDKYCAFPDRRCGKGEAGTCVAVPLTTACANANQEIVCLCSDELLKSRCQGASFALDVSVNAVCAFDDPAYARCGFLYCPTGKTRCVESVDAGTLDYRCVVAP